MQPSRLLGEISEHMFAASWYKFVTSKKITQDESYILIPPKLDMGWDFMIPKNNKRIQIKTHNINTYNGKKGILDLRRKRNKGVGNYTGNEFDYLGVYNTGNGEIIITSVEDLKKYPRQDMNKFPTSCKVYPGPRSPGIINCGFKALL